ncbi:MAG: PA14 domain-containing protein [Chloroflexota bacterium]
MRNTIWFLLGCGLALVLVGAILLRPLRAIGADTATATPAATARSATPAPTPTLAIDSLLWRREGGIAGLCDRLTILADGQAYYGRCNEGQRVGHLTAAERATYERYASAYAPFQHQAQDNPGRPDNLALTLRFPGLGARAATDAEQATVAAWVATVYARLMQAEQQGDLVAAARLDLAMRLGRSADAIQTLAVESVDWPDSCLGIAQAGQMCATVITPGVRILLQADGRAYEYRASLRGLVMPAQVVAPATATLVAATSTRAGATSAPTATIWPTITPPPTAYAVPSDGWLGLYYANPTLSGSPVLVRTDRGLGFDWGLGGPGGLVPADHFSVRWARRVRLSAGDYNYKVKADDGVRLWVDGQLLLDQWSGGAKELVANLRLGEGEHTVVVEYFELEGSAHIQVSWGKLYPPKTATRTSTPTAKPTLTPLPTRTPTATPVITAWRGEYYANRQLSGAPALVRNDEHLP